MTKRTIKKRALPILLLLAMLLTLFSGIPSAMADETKTVKLYYQAHNSFFKSGTVEVYDSANQLVANTDGSKGTAGQEGEMKYISFEWDTESSADFHFKASYEGSVDSGETTGSFNLHSDATDEDGALTLYFAYIYLGSSYYDVVDGDIDLLFTEIFGYPIYETVRGVTRYGGDVRVYHNNEEVHPLFEVSAEFGENQYSQCEDRDTLTAQGYIQKTFLLITKNANSPYYFKMDFPFSEGVEGDKRKPVEDSLTRDELIEIAHEWNYRVITYSSYKMVEANFKVPAGVPFKLESKGSAHFVPFTLYTPEEIDTTSDPAYNIYKYELPAGVTFRYEAGGRDENGELKYLQQMQSLSIRDTADGCTIVVPEPELIETKGYSYNYSGGSDFSSVSDVYMNFPDSRYLEISAGETVSLHPIRVWQAQLGLVDNAFHEPDYQVEVIGSSVTTENNSSGALGNIDIAAAGEGVSVIKITYDPLVWLRGNTDTADIVSSGETVLTINNKTYFNAIDPVNTGVVIVNVTSNKMPDTFKTNIDQREYDTIYFDKNAADHVEYTFTPISNSEIAVRVHDPLHISEWGSAWTNYNAAADGSYTVRLKEGRNIIEVSSGGHVQYHVVNAKGVTINMFNKSNPAWEYGDPVKAGETLSISFAKGGLVSPLQKIAGIYNPKDTHVQYTASTGQVFSGMSSQYGISSVNTTDITFSEPGTITLTGGISVSHWGSAVGAHREIAGPIYPNLSAPISDGTLFSTLPELTFAVESSGNTAEQQKLDYASLLALRYWNGLHAQVDLNEIRTRRNIDLKDTLSQGNLQGYIILGNYIKDTSIKSIATRTWNGSNIAGAETGSIDYDASVGYGQGTYLKGPASGEVAYGELTITPKEDYGYPVTYTFRRVNDSDYGKFPYITDIQVYAAENVSDMGFFDGRLTAAADSLDLGYGFLATRAVHRTTVPNSVSKINLSITPLTEADITGQSPDVTTIVDVEFDGKTITPDANGLYLVEGLEVGDNTITVTGAAPNDSSKTVEYSIAVRRVAGPREITALLGDGESLLIRNSSGLKISPEGSGNYNLPIAKGYSFYLSKDGYLTKTGSFDVEEDTESISLPSFTEDDKITQTAGSARVTVAAQNSILRDKHTVAFDPASVPDLARQGYVEYNHGGYTVLHALVNALDACHADYKCLKGVLTPQTKTSGDVGANAGWICEVNGVNVIDYANTLVTDGDAIAFYYNADTSPDMLHAWFEETSLSAPKDGSATLTLKAAPVGNSDPEAKTSPVGGASIYMAGKEWGKTDAQGQITLDNLSDLSLGSYAVTACKADQDGNEMLTYACALLTVTKTDSSSTPGDKIAVSFRLIGATPSSEGIDLGDGDYKGSNYVTWIKTTPYNLDQGSSVFDLFDLALKEESMGYVAPAEHSNNYISSIQTPPALEGYWLAEFDNGYNSGWMYTVNGSHPNVGLKDYNLQNGDEVIWHYVNDYLYEVNDWFDGSLGNSSTWSKWLQAADETLASNEADVAEAKSAVESLDYTLSMETANTEAAVKAWIEAEIAKLDLNGVAADIVMGSFTPAIAGTGANPGGTEGSFTFTVNLSKGEGEALASDSLQISGGITAGGDAEGIALTPEVEAYNGTAAAILTEAELDGAIDAVKQEGGDVTIAPRISGKADKVTVELPKASLSSLASATEAGLRVETPVGLVSIPHDILLSIVEQAEGDSITVSLESVDKETKLSDEQKKAVGDKPVYQVTIKSGEKEISSFEGGRVAISLPYTLKEGETAAEVKVWYLNEAGELEEIACTYDTTTGLATFTTDHLSYFTVGVVKSENDDAAEAKKVDDLIAAISDPVTLADKAKIEEARAAYNALTDPQKDLVTKLDQLKAAEAALAELHETKAVEDKIAAIGTVTLESKGAIEEARAVYDALSPAEADLVTNYQTLIDAETAYAALVAEKKDADEAKKVDDLIAKISDPVTLADKAKIEEARAAYDALTPAQADLVSNYQTLTTAEDKLADLLKPVKAAEKQIEELPAAISVTEDEMLALFQASKAFDELSDEKKAQLDKQLREKLSALQKQAAKLNHTSNGVQISGFPWYIILTAEPIKEGDSYAAMNKEAEKGLGTGGTILGMYDLLLQTFANDELVEYLLDGETVTITITIPDLAKYKNIKIVHQLLNGEYEYIEPSQIEGNKVTFIVKSLSKYAVVGQLIEEGSQPTPQPGDEQSKPSTEDKGKKAPKTGDFNSALPAILLLVALCVGSYIYCRRRKEENRL